MPALVESMFSVRQLPWHGQGKVIENAATGAEAIVAAGLNWTVEGKELMTTDGYPVPGYRANVRTHDGKVLGMVSDEYTIVQNVDGFNFLDSLVGNGIRYETAGSLKDGKVVWMLARMEKEYKVSNGEYIMPYLALSMSHDGSTAFQVFETPTRIVCANTLAMAINGAKGSIMKSRHTANVLSGDKVAEAQKMFGLLDARYTKAIGTYSLMAERNVSQAEVDAVVARLFPAQEGKSDTWTRRREGVKQVFYGSPETCDGRTAYGLYNAVTEYSQFISRPKWGDERRIGKILGADEPEQQLQVVLDVLK